MGCLDRELNEIRWWSSAGRAGASILAGPTEMVPTVAGTGLALPSLALSSAAVAAMVATAPI